MTHLDNEFKQPLFSEQIQHIQKQTARMLDSYKIGHLPRSAQDIRNNLWKVIERGTFKGTCEICEEFDVDLVKLE